MSDATEITKSLLARVASTDVDAPKARLAPKPLEQPEISQTLPAAIAAILSESLSEESESMKRPNSFVVLAQLHENAETGFTLAAFGKQASSGRPSSEPRRTSVRGPRDAIEALETDCICVL